MTTKTINLTEVESAAYEGLTLQQAEIQKKATEIQARIVKVSQEVFGARKVDFSTAQNPVLSDDKKTITYEVVKTDSKQDKLTKE